MVLALSQKITAAGRIGADPLERTLRWGDSGGGRFGVDAMPGLPGADWVWENAVRSIRSEVRVESEFEVVVDRSFGRVGITGWRGVKSCDRGKANDAEPGFMAGYHAAAFDDAGWPGLMTTIAEGPWREESVFWARTRVELPVGMAGEDLTLILGGCGLFDFDTLRIFVNGHLAAVREVSGRWRQPGRFVHHRGSREYGWWNFGGENVIAVQQHGYQSRSRELDAVDEEGYRMLPLKCQWPVPWEQEIVFGRPDEKIRFERESVERGTDGQLLARMTSPELEASLAFRFEDNVLRKSVALRSRASEPVTILEVGLGDYVMDCEVSDGEQGFPVYAGEDWFLGIEHPSGFATGSGRRVRLRQYPGTTLSPGESWSSMTAVIGAGNAAGARAGFFDYLVPKMRRKLRGHDRPYAIIEPFGAKAQGSEEEFERFWKFGYFDEDEAFLLDHLAKVAAMQAQTGCRFDGYFVDFWNAYAGGVDEPDPARFPAGFGPVFDRIRALGMEPGLWMDSSWERWSCGGNPAVDAGLTHDPRYGSDRPTLCRATEPYRTMFTDAFVRFVRDSGVRFLKFDNLQTCCFNPAHSHRPGRAATEAIQSAVIETLRAVDAACPDVFIMLYWGHRSPWWLLHGDTLFEPGLLIEAAHPGGKPTLYARDSVTLGLDQAHRFCRDTPALGKDSLGVWMSEWKWNSCLGTERWAEAMVMDLGRGSLMLQPWSDPEFLDHENREILARLVHLLETFPACFAEPRGILGDPWRNEPYGFQCRDEERTFVGVHNVSWECLSIAPQDLGLPNAAEAEWIRWFPDPARWGQPAAGAVIELAPFDVVLFEVAKEVSESAKLFPAVDWPPPPGRVTLSVPVHVTEKVREPARSFPRPPGALPPVPEDARYEKRVFAVEVPAGDGLLVLSVELTRDGMPAPLEDAGSHLQLAGPGLVPVLADQAFSTPWQAWRIDADSSRNGFSASLDAVLPENTACHFTARRLPFAFT